MESSLSSPHHRRRLSGVNGFSSKHAYDDVFSSPATLGARKVKSRVLHDYKEIFSSSRASSIPLLDISPPGGVDADSVSDYRNSELDYSNIFGGLRDDDASACYEQVLAIANAAGTNTETTTTSRKVRTPSATESPLHSSECLKTSGENKMFPTDAPSESFDDKKHFSMSYHKCNTGSKDGTNGTTHVAQFHPVRGFTCFIDETTPQKIEANKPKSSVASDVCSKADINETILQDRNTKRGTSHLTKKETFGSELKSRDNISWDGSYSYDKIFNSLENNLTSHPTEKGPPSSIPAKIDSYGNSKRLWASNSTVFKNDASEHVTGEGSPCLLGEEFDVNSAAAASAAVLKDAIQKAQESIRIAKELMERKKEGLRSHSSHSLRNNKKVKDKGEHFLAYESNRLDDTNAKDISGSVDYVSQLFSGIRKKSAVRNGLFPDFKQNERTYITGNVIDDERAKKRGMAEECESPSIEKKREVPENENVMEQQQVHKENTDEKAQELVYVNQKFNTVKCENQTEIHEDKVERVRIAREHKKIENCSIIQEDGVIEEINTDIPINKDGEKKLKDSHEKNKDALKSESDIDLRLNNVQELEDIEKEGHIAKTTKTIERDGSGYRVEKNCDEVDSERYEDTFQRAEGHELEKACVSECVEKQAKDIFTRPDAFRRPEKFHEEEIGGMNLLDTHDGKESEQSSEDFELEKNEKDLTGRFEKAEFICLETEKIELLQEAHHESDVWCHVHDKDETQKVFRDKVNHVHSETGQEVDDHGSATKDCYNFEVNELEAVKSPYKMRKTEHLRTGNLPQGLNEENETVNSVRIVCEVSRSENSPPKFASTCINFGGEEFAQQSKDIGSDSNLDRGIDILASECAGSEDILEDRMSFNEEAGKNELGYVNDDRRHDVQFEISQEPSVSKAKEKTVEVDIEIKTREDTTKNEEGVHKTFMMDEKKMKMDEEIRARKGKEVYDESSSKVFVMEKEALLKNNEEKKKDREREKEKIAVERAIREARERAFAEARERAERAAVERATAEVRQRVMAEARENFDKDTAATKLSTEKASVEAKLRSERAAVERATTEARERALEKALSQKSRVQTGRSTSQNHAGPSRDNPTKKNSSSELETNCENNTNLLQMNKANVEKHERIMERTAKALAEKNMRDLLAQKELAEKNRLAEALDADIKRWSKGKEGNLRALLSTLQYILGPSSGWQPISLTEIITTNAVKKAYRKATLYVHPDKLQQRGASIQQKYICEKVFDLLKAAWNKFNKEER
ncbi:hypothetical protein POM88_046825 [Heracleum sosnowskyi]|uniref:J domain-containing protein n=1 Tax=Heracleum sosnowskyi TaxID=360622 RepID=A0AAD8H9B9_9APIA|nr:hypothetical protein POM88_046825 [Heracleum sosnowskyi]